MSNQFLVPVDGRLNPDRCDDPDCDGDAGHDGPHFQWIMEAAG